MKNIFVVTTAVLLFALFLAGCTGKSAFVGTWVTVDGRSAPSGIPDDLELYKDGTGIGDGMSLKWKVEKGRIAFDVGSRGYAYDYKLFGSTLTLTDDNGRSAKYKKNR